MVQLMHIHGGMTFKNHDDYIDYLKTRSVRLGKKLTWWTDYLDEQLGNEVEIIRPRMPLQDCAEYEDWRIWFERHIEFLEDNIILVGSSLGGIFLAKYLSENKFPKKILSLYLVCPPFDDELGGQIGKYGNKKEDLAGGFELEGDLSLIEENCDDVTLMFSEDDDVVLISHADKYRAKLNKSKIIVYESKNGHFQIEEFPEIIEMMKDDLKRI